MRKIYSENKKELLLQEIAAGQAKLKNSECLEHKSEGNSQKVK